MSKWDDIKKSIGDIADKTVAKTKEITDTASLKIKIANKEAERDTEYRILGKLAYSKLKGLSTTDADDLTVQISNTLEHIDTLNKEIAQLKDEDELRRAEKKAEKEAKETAKKQKDEEEERQQEEINKKVMEDFNNARKKADDEYEKAKKSAEEAK